MKHLLTALLLLVSLGASAEDIRLAWTEPTTRGDGSAVVSIDKYDILHSINNVAQPPIEVGVGIVEYVVVDVAQGTHVFQIRAVEGGLEGRYSDPVSASFLQARIGPMLITIEVVGP